jgi:hypothetical protein
MRAVIYAREGKRDKAEEKEKRRRQCVGKFK